MKHILCVVTSGEGKQDELRVRRLFSKLYAQVDYCFINKKAQKLSEIRRIYHLLTSQNWDLIYQEGTGIAGGLPLILVALLYKQRFVVSSGDPIAGFFRTTKGILFGTIFDVYERLLYKSCSGFIGWTPYLTGVAIRLGAKKAVTVEGGVDKTVFYKCSPEAKKDIRLSYGLNPEHIIIGVVGSLIWVPPQSYCYGYELVETFKRIKRNDVSILIVGDGDGKKRLEKTIPTHLQSRAVFTGRISESEVANAMNAMDIGLVTLFGEMGNYRLTTKLPEYLACGVPVAMNPTAAFYDYAAEAGWDLPDKHPADPAFHQQFAEWLDQLSRDQIEAKAAKTTQVVSKFFDYSVIGPKFVNFIHMLLYGHQASHSEKRASTTLK